MTPSSNGTPSPPVRHVELRSEEVQEILGHMPGWALRWGITVVMGVIVLILLASWFVHYPDTITARITLTTQTPPAPIIGRADGRLQLKVIDQEAVERGQVLGIINSPARYEDIQALQQTMTDYQTNGLSLVQVEARLEKDWQLGEVQDAYLLWYGSLQDRSLTQELVVYEKQMAEIRERIQHYQTLNHQLEKQQQLLIKEVMLADKTFARDQALFEEGTIAEAAFEEGEARWLQAWRSLETAKAGITNNQITISQLQAEVTELGLQQTQEQRGQQQQIETALRQLESQLARWQQQYVLTSPIDGTVAFTKYWSDAQYVRPNEEVLTVVPASNQLYGQVLMPMAGSGKVAVGQTVYIRFDNYPSAEYGMVTGQVASIAAVPRENMYTIEVKLPPTLTTSYRKTLPFRQEMQGAAEIITQDLRLLERLFYQLKKLVDHAS